MNNARIAIQRLEPYSPPPPGRSTYRGLLLDFNERTGPLSGTIRRALKTVALESINRYPEYEETIRAVSAYAGVSPSMILLTNGSDEGIDLVMRTFVGPNDPVIIPRPSFSMFFQAAAIAGAAVLSPSYMQNGRCRFPTEEILAAITKKTKLIILCNPNNPTGTPIPLSDIERIVKKARTATVLIDEAYTEFSEQTSVALLATYPNVVIARTFSKAFGLAGLRIGYLIAHADSIAEFAKVKSPYSVNTYAARAAQSVLADSVSMQRYVREVMGYAKPMLERFLRQAGVPYFLSSANFVLIAPKNPKKVAAALSNAGILVRVLTKPEFGTMLRVTVGTRREAKQFIRIYTDVVLTEKIALIDRDGTLIYEPQDTFQVDTVSQLRLLPGVCQSLTRLRQMGYALVMITNQDGLGTRTNPRPAFDRVQQELLRRLRARGITFEQVLICPHLPSDGCSCRKPKTGLLTALGARARKIALVIGDRSSDRQLAKNLGVPFVAMKTNGNMSAAFSTADALTRSL